MPAFSCVPSAVVEDQGQCPEGFAETAAQVIVAFEAEIPSADVAAPVFFLGFLAAFTGARVVAMLIRVIVQLVKS